MHQFCTGVYNTTVVGYTPWMFPSMIPEYIPENEQNNQFWYPSVTETATIDWVPEYDRNSQVWYPSVIKPARFGTRV